MIIKKMKKKSGMLHVYLSDNFHYTVSWRRHKADLALSVLAWSIILSPSSISSGKNVVSPEDSIILFLHHKVFNHSIIQSLILTLPGFEDIFNSLSIAS